mmetsp:Transcript_54902/g.130368  ORF Transcript_54902/g.130368 Transcript_54902/m.130368 type:complete len:242 (+) Transcript_54902:317-1042(+)
MAMTGPNTSSVNREEEEGTLSKITGPRKYPPLKAGGREVGWERSSATPQPSALYRSIASCTLSKWGSEMSAPMFVVSANGSPMRILRVRSTSRFTNSAWTSFATRTRVPLLHTSPCVQKFAIMAADTASSMSASPKMTRGDFPPSSRVTCFSVSAAALAMRIPVGTDPVSDTFLMRGFSTSNCPVDPSPCNTLTSPGGTPADSRSCTRRLEVSGERGEGLRMKAFPHASAGAIFHAAPCTG